jgi:hypothetical protein
MDVPSARKNGKQADRPDPCRRCGTPACWDGGRAVAQVVPSVAGGVEWDPGIWRRRACCPNPDCPVQSWTVYEPGGYPHRTFTLAVSVSGVAQLAADDATTPGAVAHAHQCDRRTVGRWVAWVVRLCTTVEVVRACARLDPTGLPPPPPPRRETARACAGWVLLLLDHLVRLLRERGVTLEPGAGLVAIVRQQFVRFGVVLWLTRPSPPLHIEVGGLLG